MTAEEILPWLRLARLPGVGPILAGRLLTALGSPAAILDAHPARLAEIEGIGPRTASAIASAAKATLADAQREFDAAINAGFTLLPLHDPRYPAALRTITDPPLVLYVRGKLLPADALAIGVVGARQCTLYGRETAGKFGRALAEQNITVISGGARGIDTCAHEGALLAAGRTIVVQGCGLLHTYPPENKKLYDRIVAENAGAILSDFPLETPPIKENFPPRNRIIAGMSLGVLVVEANLRSGSLITARLAAADYGREVFAVPGRIDSPASAGTHHLIKSGTAVLVESVEDILDNLGEVGAALRKHTVPPPAPSVPAASESSLPLLQTQPAPQIPALTPIQHQILQAIAPAGSTIDEMLDATGLSAGVIMAELTMLQLAGAVGRTSTNRFTRARA